MQISGLHPRVPDSKGFSLTSSPVMLMLLSGPGTMYALRTTVLIYSITFHRLEN